VKYDLQIEVTASQDDGSLYTCGRNDSGQCGVGDFLNKNKPVRVEALKDEKIVAVACGEMHTICISGWYNLRSISCHATEEAMTPLQAIS
jgi:catabolite regulation protein CreA